MKHSADLHLFMFISDRIFLMIVSKTNSNNPTKNSNPSSNTNCVAHSNLLRSLPTGADAKEQKKKKGK